MKNQNTGYTPNLDFLRGSWKLMDFFPTHSMKSQVEGLWCVLVCQCPQPGTLFYKCLYSVITDTRPLGRPLQILNAACVSVFSFPPQEETRSWAFLLTPCRARGWSSGPSWANAMNFLSIVNAATLMIDQVLGASQRFSGFLTKRIYTWIVDSVSPWGVGRPSILYFSA